MSNAEYWDKRFEMLENAQMLKAEEYYDKLIAAYDKALKSIEKDIYTWYGRFASNNAVTLEKAKILLTDNELKEFKWDVEDYIKYGQLNGINKLWERELENASSKVHISRLEALKMQIRQKIEEISQTEVQNVSELNKSIYKDTYYHSAYEIAKGLNVGVNLSKLDDDKVLKIISVPWTTDNTTFSDRIWNNKQKLIDTLETNLVQALIRGDSLDNVIEKIAKTFKTSKNRAGNLIMTEAAFFSSTARNKCFKDLNVKKYEIVATLDTHTSEICRELDGKVFDIKDYKVGTTASPFHNWCRSTEAPYFDDVEISERAARNDEGNTYYVPSNITYNDWYKNFVDESDGDLRRKVKGLLHGQKVIKYNEIDKKYKEEFENGLKDMSNQNARVLIEKYAKNTDYIVVKGAHNRSLYNGLSNTVVINVSNTPSTLAHEIFHKIDIKNSITKEGKLLSNILKDKERLFNDLDETSVVKLLKREFPTAFTKNRKMKDVLKPEYRGISDILNGMSNGKIKLGYGHDSWDDTKLSKEVWGQFGRILYQNNKSVEEMLEYILPSTKSYVNIKIKRLVK